MEMRRASLARCLTNMSMNKHKIHPSGYTHVKVTSYKPLKRSIQLVLLLVILVVLSNCQKKPDNILYEKRYIDEIKAVRKDILLYLTQNQIPGGAIAVTKNGKLIYSEGLGLASKDLQVKSTRKTKFRIGGLSELYTSFIYLKMVEEGLLHPDSSIQHFLPDFPKKEAPVKLSHLVYKTSGFRNARNTEKKAQALHVNIQSGLNNFKDDPLIEIPGRFQTESIYDYNALGAVMEKATNQRFRYILRDYVTDTLNLENTIVDNPFATIDHRTDFFDYNYIAQVVNATTIDLGFQAPSQGILSNAEDLVKFGNALQYSNLLSDNTKKEMFEPVIQHDQTPSAYANGWIHLKDDYGNKIYGRSGSVTGGSAAILLYPELELAIAFVTNLDVVDEIPIFDFAKHFLEPTEESYKSVEKKD